MTHSDSEITHTYRHSAAFRSALRSLVEADASDLDQVRERVNEPAAEWPLSLRVDPDRATLVPLFRMVSFLLETSATSELFPDHLYEEIVGLVKSDGGTVKAPDALQRLLELDPRAEEARLRESAQHRAMAAVNHVDVTLDFRVDEAFGRRRLRPVYLLTLILDQTLGGDATVSLQLPEHALRQLQAELHDVVTASSEIERDLIRADLADPAW